MARATPLLPLLDGKRWLGRSRLEDRGNAFERLSLPIGNLLCVDAEFAAELSKRFDSFERFEDHFGSHRRPG